MNNQVILTKNIAYTKQLNLSYRQKLITLEFSSLSYSPEKIKYYYKLEGFDRDWIVTGAGYRSAIYSNLSPGQYILKIRSCHDDGEWNQKSSELIINILPPFWRTWWFTVLYSLTFLGLALLFIYGRIIQVENQKRTLKKLVEEKISELQLQKDILEGVNKILTESQDELKQQKEDLLELTSLLEKRQTEIEVQNREIQEQYDLSQHQKIKIELQHKEINASIRYALQIQQAILPGPEFIADILNEYFILLKPRDVLSGDFYWAAKKDNKSYIAAADCTGHGVPGAVMSMLGISLLNEVMNDPMIYNAAEILEDSLLKNCENTGQKR